MLRLSTSTGAGRDNIVGDLLGQLQGMSLGPTTPVLLHLVKLGVGLFAVGGVEGATAAVLIWALSQPPTEGKLSGIQPRAAQVSSDI